MNVRAYETMLIATGQKPKKEAPLAKRAGAVMGSVGKDKDRG